MEPYLKRYRWVIVALLWLLYITFGLVTRSVSPLITPILKDLGITYSQMGFILGSWQLTYIAVAVIAGTIIDRWGVRRPLFIGTVIIGLSATLRYFPGGFGGFLPAVALFGVGGPLISVGAPKAISMWFSGKSRGTAVGIYMTGLWIGGLVAFTATNSFVMPLTGYSWRLTFVCYGLVTFVVALLWWLLARDIKPAEDTGSSNISMVFGRLIKERNVRVILLIGLLSFTVTHGFTNWLPQILEKGGFSPTTSGFVASIPLFVSIPAVLVIPRVVSPRLRRRFIALLALLVVVALMLSVTASSFTLIMGLVLFGIAGSSLLPLLMLVLMDTPEVGSEYMGSAGGMFFCVAEIGGFAGPLLMGALADMTGDFLAGTAFLAVLCLFIFAVTFLLRTPPAFKPESL